MNRGKLIALEGIDGCGKSTQAVLLADALRADGHDVLLTREPTDGPTGRRIRAMARSGKRVPAFEELGWFFEDRREHVVEVIAPALAAGRTVLTDRYFLSTVAYQGARGLDWREILARSEGEFPLPDAALLFVLPAADGLARVETRGGPAEPAFEQADFLEKVASIFAALDLPYLVRIDAAGDVDEVAERTRSALAEKLRA